MEWVAFLVKTISLGFPAFRKDASFVRASVTYFDTAVPYRWTDRPPHPGISV